MKIEPYKTYKDSGIEWLGEVPEHWEIRRVKDIIKRIGNGVTPRGGSEVYTDLGVIFLRSQNVYDDGLRIDNVSFIPEKIHEGMKNSQLETGDILINITGASIGRTCLFSLESGSANINQHIAFLRTKFWIDEFYISLFLKSHFIKNYIEIEQNGASKEAFNLSQIANIPLVLPSQSEQKAIAHYLDTKTAQIDRKIDLLTQKAALYGNLKQSLINETVTRGLDKSVPMKDSGVEWIGEVPGHWRVRRLKDIGNSIIGITYSPEDVLDDETSGILVLRSSNIQNHQLSLSDTVYVSKMINPRQILRKGDILICSRNGSRVLIGKNICIDERTEGQTFGAFMTVYRSKYFIFISKFFNSNVFESQSGLFGSSTINQLTINTLNNFLVILPPLPEQKAIAHYLDTKTAQIDQIIQTINTQIEKLRELRKTLINDVVTGKIKVIDDF
jgi:type I restriction enzyme, S subunit